MATTAAILKIYIELLLLNRKPDRLKTWYEKKYQGDLQIKNS